jgi:hypothetical protein
MDKVFLNNFLALQILVECIADELIESDVIKRENLDNRVQEKIKAIEQLNDMLKQMDSESTINFFQGNMGEA